MSNTSAQPIASVAQVKRFSLINRQGETADAVAQFSVQIGDFTVDGTVRQRHIDNARTIALAGKRTTGISIALQSDTYFAIIEAVKTRWRLETGRFL